MTIREEIGQMVRRALLAAEKENLLPPAGSADPSIERPQNAEHGDFASSVAMKLASPMRKGPMDIAEVLASLITPGGAVDRVWTARPGFVNFSLSPTWLRQQVDVILLAGQSYGNVDVGAGRSVQVEFVSVNPTGPLHVGHARGAVFGSALANVLEAAGYLVVREYYVNDAGSQMEKFNLSLFARYQQLLGRKAELPDDGYRGEYLIELAERIKVEDDDAYLNMPEADGLSKLGEKGLGMMIDSIRADVGDLRVSYDVWFSERSLYKNGQYDAAMKLLADGGYLVEREGAMWFTSTSLGDDQDKVVVRSNGAPTYFAADIAYHYNKFFERRFDRVIDVLGADHQGHVRFMKAVATALEIEDERLSLLVYQLVTLKRGDEAVRVSKRTGDLVTLHELVDEVGADACRFFFLARSPESQMEFDLELATKESSENPVYYVQYAHARISSILRLADERGVDYGDGDLTLLEHEAELALIRKMAQLPELVETMARSLEPHHLPHYAVAVATAFHWFYERCRVVSSAPEDAEITRARLKLVEAARIVLARCLALMLMDAPTEM